MDEKQKTNKKTIFGRRWAVLIIASAFSAVSAISIYFYICKLNAAFLDNTQFYMREIAAHDTNSVDQVIAVQWDRLRTVGNKLALMRFEDNIEELQQFLNLETAATCFENLILLDEEGIAYEANYLIEDVSQNDWASNFLQTGEPFVIRDQTKLNFIVRDNYLFYGVPIEPVRIAGITFVGVIGTHRNETVKSSLQVSFFGGEGLAQVVEHDGTIVTSGISQQGALLENLLEQLANGKAMSGERYEGIEAKLAAGEVFDSVYMLDGVPIIMTARPLQNAEWTVVVTAPLSVASSQTTDFLKITVLLLSVLSAVIGVVLVFAFISYRRTSILKNSKEIFYRERLFNLMAIHTDDVFAIVNAGNRKLTFVSANVRRTLGVDPAPGIGVEQSLLPREFQQTLKKEIDDMLSRQLKADEHDHMRAEYEFEWIMPADRTAKWMHMTVYFVLADFTEPPEPCLIVVLSDYTQVREDQRKLEEARERAQEAAQSKSTFLSTMSHEMRTPLNGIVGCIGLMGSHLNDPGMLRGYLQKLESTSRYLISLVSDILDMSKIENHKLTLEDRPISPRTVCTNMETLFAAQMQEKGIHFSVEPVEPLLIVRGDEVRIQQVLTNLLSNAQKFTDKGGSVSLRIWQEPAKNGRVKTIATVSDTGIGMSEAFLERIWCPFEQERLNTSRLHGGTGLGLAISYELTQLMGGTLSVSSEVGKGSVFTMEAVQELVGPDASADVPIEELPIWEDDLAGMTILVAEDNALNMEIIAALLEERKARILTAANGEEAVNVFRASAPDEIDAILMDMQMPVMDGCAATRAIRELGRPDAGRVPVIACTANAFQEDMDLAMASGMDGHIAKPLDVGKLIKLLKQLQKGAET